jgi:hypothetical protein
MALSSSMTPCICWKRYVDVDGAMSAVTLMTLCRHQQRHFDVNDTSMSSPTTPYPQHWHWNIELSPFFTIEKVSSGCFDYAVLTNRDPGYHLSLEDCFCIAAGGQSWRWLLRLPNTTTSPPLLHTIGLPALVHAFKTMRNFSRISALSASFMTLRILRLFFLPTPDLGIDYRCADEKKAS